MSDYGYRTGELLVHADDCAAVTPDLAHAGFRPADASGSVRRFVGGHVRVPDLLAHLRARHGTGLRVSPNHVYTADRIIWGSLRPRPTTKSLEHLPPLTGGERVAVGVVDTGIVRHGGEPHPYLDGRVEFGEEDVDPVVPDRDGNPTGSDGHGTFVTGLVLREAPQAKVIMKGVVDKSTGEIEDLAVAHAITRLGEAGVKLINLSFSGSSWEDAPPLAIEDALLGLAPDVVVVAAAGNRGSTQLLWPAALDLGQGHAEVLAVGATVNGEVAAFSGYGPWVSAYAPGVDRVGPYFAPGYPTPRRRDDTPFSGWAEWSGTSFAAATVTGRLAALMAANGGSAIEAWKTIQDGPGTVSVTHVNGPRDHPHVLAT
ncbi:MULTISPECIES: S8 family peptidase [unclassified Saccharothrix]|uniref:S8 family peptidase n=1 Tax=unclassified Saccharothrix TaxID=2593673 RepID=UPI00307E4B03